MTTSDRRFESIQGLLSQRGDARRPAPTRQPRPAGEGQPGLRTGLAAVGARPADDVGPAAQLPKLSPRRDTPAADPARAQAAETRSGTAGKGGTRRVAIRLPQQLHSALVERVERDGSSQGHVVLDAIEFVHARGIIGEVVARSSPSGGRADGLFDRTRLRGRVEPSVPVELRLRASALEQVDRLAAEHGAESRTQLVTAALAAYLVGAADANTAMLGERDRGNAISGVS